MSQAAIAVRFETLDDFLEEIQAEGLVDGELVRAQVENQQVNDGLANILLRCGFVSESQVREVVVHCGEIARGGDPDFGDAKELLKQLSAVCAERSLDVRKGRFELVVM